MPKERLRCVYYVDVFTLLLIVMNVTKLAYHNPRPFWVSPEIKAFACSGQFGNPSGHSETSIGMALTLWLDLVYSTEGSILNKSLWLMVSLAFAFSIGYSRLFLGVHSIDQIVFGLLLGTWIACFMFFLVKEKIDL